MLQIIDRERAQLDALGIKPVLVHMSSSNELQKATSRFGAQEVSAIPDPSLAFYRIFGIPKANLVQVLGPVNWVRAWDAGLRHGCGVGSLKGDGFQLAGLALLEDGEISKIKAYSSVSEEQSFTEFCKQSLTSLAQPANQDGSVENSSYSSLNPTLSQ